MKSFIKTLFLNIACCMALTSCEVLVGIAEGALMGIGGAGMGVPSYGGYNSSYSSTSNAILNSEMQMANSASRLNAMGINTYDSSSSSSSSFSTSNSSSSSNSTRQCPSCQNTKHCSQCRGTGHRTDNMFGTGTDASKKCGVCGGSGVCPRCKGTGRI